MKNSIEIQLSSKFHYSTHDKQHQTHSRTYGAFPKKYFTRNVKDLYNWSNRLTNLKLLLLLDFNNLSDLYLSLGLLLLESDEFNVAAAAEAGLKKLSLGWLEATCWDWVASSNIEVT